MFYNLEQELDLNGCFLSEESQFDLAYYQDLVLVNKVNQNPDDLDIKELIRYRVKLILKKILPVDELLEDIPDSTKKNLTEVSL